MLRADRNSYENEIVMGYVSGECKKANQDMFACCGLEINETF